MYSISRRAFTLIELLVVVAVIAILATILYPVMSRARERALRNRCLANLREISIAAMTYTADHDETYPLARFTASHHDGMKNWTWKRAVLPYLNGDAAAFRCPRVENPWAPCPEVAGAVGDPSNARPEFQIGADRGYWLPASYAYSGGFFATNGNSLPRRTTDMANPSAVLYIISSRLGGAEIGPEALEQHGVNPATGAPDPHFWNRFGPFPAHLGRIPCVMADGHVRNLTVLDTVAPVDLWQSSDPKWNSHTGDGRRRLLAAAAGMQNEVTEYR